MNRAMRMSEKEKDRIERQLAVALERARLLWPSASERAHMRVAVLEPTGIYVSEDMRSAVNVRSS